MGDFGQAGAFVISAMPTNVMFSYLELEVMNWESQKRRMNAHRMGSITLPSINLIHGFKVLDYGF